MELKKTAIGTLAAVALVVIPALGAHAAVSPHIIYNTVSFTPGATTGNGCGTAAGSTILGVYGSSALKGYIIAASKAFATAQGCDSTHAGIDVEYAGGGDSCPGDVFAAGDSTDPILGVSDVFAPSCAVEGFSVGTVALTDTNVNVNPVLAIANCPGATEPQGGALYPPTTITPCNGSGDPTAGANFAMPNNASLGTVAALYSQGISNFSQIGGVNTTIAGSPQYAVQNRILGSGTRVTWCFNTFPNGGQPIATDACLTAGKAQAEAPTTGQMLKDVCGSAALDGLYGVGYASRSPIVTPTVAGCGTVNISGVSAWNGNCNPASPSTQNSPSPVDGVNNCNGDNKVADNEYPIWGYEHLVANKALTGANAAAVQSFISFLQIGNTSATAEDTILTQQLGFIRACQVGFSRSFDGGPVGAQTASC